MSAITVDYELRCGENSDIVDHLPRLHAEATRQGVQVIELGVRSGNSTAAFLAAAEANGGHVWSVDIAWPHVPQHWETSGLWTVAIGDDLDLAEHLPDLVDIVFIDTSHTFDQTLAELYLYVGKVRPGGVILCHDTELERPDASPSTDPPFPVAAAIHEFTNDVGYPVEWVTGCHGLGVIRIPGGDQ